MKKFILSLFVWFIWIISFCSAETFPNWFISDYSYSWTPYTSDWDLTYFWDFVITPVWDWKFLNQYGRDAGYSTIFTLDDWSDSIYYSFSDWSFYSLTDTLLRRLHLSWTFLLSCTWYCYFDYDNLKFSFSDSYSIWSSCPECPTCDPQYTIEQCQSVYWLVSSWLLNTCQSDLNSCQSNTSWFNDQLNNCNLSLNACNSSLTNCLQYNCPEIDYTWDLLRSNIYINNILHPWRQFINIDIPDYITWDYSVGDDDFNLYVWSGYDVDYIESVIDINSYRPTSEDFTNVFVSGLTLVMPYIVIVLFIIFVRKLLKRIFK